MDSEAVVLEKTDGDVSVELRTLPIGSTAQQAEDEDIWTPDEAIRPPEDLEQLAKLSENSWVRGSCVEAMALNTVGLGWKLEPVDPLTADEKLVEEATRRLDRLAERDDRLDNPTFTELMRAVKTDEEECGNGYIEVARDRRTGRISGLFHAPGPRVRRLRDRDKGWIIARNDLDTVDPDRNLFYRFGSKVQYDSDGMPTNKLIPGKVWKRNELIPFRIFTGQSRDYGLPRDVELAIEYAAGKLAAEWNVGFFDSSGTPPTLIFVAGEQRSDGSRVSFTVPPETVSRIEETLKSGGPRQRRVAVIPVPGGTEAEAVQLGKLSERDMGFVEFQKFHSLNVCGSFRLMPLFAAINTEGRYTAEVERAITLEQTFDPEQRRYEGRLNRTLINDMGITDLGIKFTRLAVEDNAVKRDSADKLAEAGGITGRELREAHGLPPFTGDNEHLNDEIVSIGRPKGAQDRVVEGTDQRGLRPGIGARVEKAESNGNGHVHGDPDTEKEIEELVAELQNDGG